MTSHALWIALAFVGGLLAGGALRSLRSEVTLTEEVEVGSHRYKLVVTADSAERAQLALRRLRDASVGNGS